MRSTFLPLLLLVPAAAWLWWWATHNPLPDGFQNEYLLMGNAYDLWAALVDLDQWHLRWHAYTGYWPFGLYVVPWPWMALLGPSRAALLAGNLVHLGVLLWATHDLGRRLDAPLAAPLVLLCPGVFGSLVRFEPNLAAIAWTAAGLAFLLQSQGLRRLGPVLGFGCALGLGLMMDRLSVAFFLLPAAAVVALAGVGRDPRGTLLRLAAGLGVALLWSAAWYREFFLRHADELLSQAPVGEIDAAGQLHATEGPLALLYYPLSLVDSQAGPVLGGVMGVGLLAAAARLVRRPRLDDPRLPLVATVALAGAFFTLVAKKQVFYTLPLLVPLAVLAGGHRRLAWLGLAGGLWSFLSTGVGLLPGGGPWLPEAWVAPRHTLARPPNMQRWPLSQATEALGRPAHVAIFSQDSTLFEGFVVLAAREAWPAVPVRGVVLDPTGSYENIDAIDALLWVGPPGGAWPTAEQVREELSQDHYDLSQVPPIDQVLVQAAPAFEQVGRWTVEGGDGPRDVVAFRRR
ncbi:hypothetical protein L6R53_18635 [Myxococcota bacterium]|nr:hypothetical protein [Myxococcota bacterium]